MTENKAPNSKRQRWIRFALIAAAIGLVVVWLLPTIERWAVFPGTRRTTTVQPPADAQVWRVEPGGAEAVLLAPSAENRSNHGACAIFAHGNGELIDDWFNGFEGYRRLGLAVLLVEYRGYGRSPGTPEAKAIVRDFAAAIETAIAKHGIDRDKLVFHGRSLGGGVVMGLMNTHKPAAIVLESTFTSLQDRASELGVPRSILAQDFGGSGSVQAYKGPVLVVHGRTDQIVPISHGEANAARANNVTTYYVDAGHNDVRHDHAYWKSVGALLASAGLNAS